MSRRPRPRPPCVPVDLATLPCRTFERIDRGNSNLPTFREVRR